MRTRAKIVATIVTAFGLIAAVTVGIGSVNARQIGRTDPKRAANYRLPWFNLSETYADGAVLGVAVGSTKVEAIQAAERTGLVVIPGGWGDNRAGGADLYDKSDLLAMMLRQPHLNFYDPTDSKLGMTIQFRENRVASINVSYINFEAI